MPKVGTIELKIKGEVKKFDLYYSSTDRFTLKNFPKDIITIVGDPVPYFHTEGALREWYQKTLHQYHELSETTKKVILYSIAIPTGKVMNKQGSGSYLGYQDWVPLNVRHMINGVFGDKIPSEGFGFFINYRIVERSDKNGVTYFKDYVDNNGGIHKHRCSKGSNEFEVDWSEKREQFFISMETQADLMVKNIITFFAEEPEKLLQIFDSGTLKLLS